MRIPEKWRNNNLSLAGNGEELVPEELPLGGSWLTCEESTLKKGDYEDRLEKDHGLRLLKFPATERNFQSSTPTDQKAWVRFKTNESSSHRPGFRSGLSDGRQG